MENKESKFIQGYVCAIATITSIIGEHTNVREAFKAGIGNKTANDLISFGVDEYDIEVLKEVNYL